MMATSGPNDRRASVSMLKARIMHRNRLECQGHTPDVGRVAEVWRWERSDGRRSVGSASPPLRRASRRPACQPLRRAGALSWARRAALSSAERVPATARSQLARTSPHAPPCPSRFASAPTRPAGPRSACPALAIIPAPARAVVAITLPAGDDSDTRLANAPAGAATPTRSRRQALRDLACRRRPGRHPGGPASASSRLRGSLRSQRRCPAVLRSHKPHPSSVS
jgi:hypothetical protein